MRGAAVMAAADDATEAPALPAKSDGPGGGRGPGPSIKRSGGVTAREERRRADIVSRPANRAPECDPNSLKSWRKGDFFRRRCKAAAPRAGTPAPPHIRVAPPVG